MTPPEKNRRPHVPDRSRQTMTSSERPLATDPRTLAKGARADFSRTRSATSTPRTLALWFGPATWGPRTATSRSRSGSSRSRTGTRRFRSGSSGTWIATRRSRSGTLEVPDRFPETRVRYLDVPDPLLEGSDPVPAGARIDPRRAPAPEPRDSGSRLEISGPLPVSPGPHPEETGPAGRRARAAPRTAGERPARQDALLSRLLSNASFAFEPSTISQGVLPFLPSSFLLVRLQSSSFPSPCRSTSGSLKGSSPR